MVGQVVCADGGPQSLLEDLLDAEALVLGQRQVTDSVVADVLLHALDERFQEVYGVVLERSQVRMAVHGQEVVPTKLVRRASCTYTSLLERYLQANICAVTCWRAPALLRSTILLLTLIITTLLRPVLYDRSREDPL